MLKLPDSKFSNIEIEKAIFAGLLKYPELYFDLSLIIKPDDFTANKLHSIAWAIFGDLLNKNEKVDYHLLALKIGELKINFNLGDLSVSEYLESLFYISSISPETVKSFVAELKKLNGRKMLAQAGVDVVNSMIDLKEDISYSEIVGLADTTFNTKINLFEQGGINQPMDVFENLQAEVENASNDFNNNEVSCPFPRMEKLYGSFIPGELYFWCARPKSNKSTFLMNLAYQCSTNINDKVKTLYIDTEISTDKFKYRLLSAISGVNEYFIRTKKWRQNEKMVEALRKAWPLVKLWMNLISHIYVGNLPMPDVISIIRRWIRKNDDDSKKIVVFDYLKLGDEFHGVSNNMRPDLILGRKTDLLKKASEELNFVSLSAAQNNRSGEISRTGSSVERRDDGATIGQSDQIAQFASQIYILGKLTAGELQDLQGNFGINDATNFCKSIYSRNLGEEGCMGFNDLIKIQKGDKIEWRENVLYYNIENFFCREIGDLATFVKERKDYKLTDSEYNDGEMLD